MYYMAAESYIHCRVPRETKARLKAIAEREERTESQVVRRLLATLPGDSADGGATPLLPRPKRTKGRRLWLRLEPNDRKHLVDRASAADMPASRYVAALVRSHLCQVAPPLDEPVRLLRQEIRSLVAVGRHLEQLTQAIEKTGRLPGSLKQEVAAMLAVSNKLRDHTRALLQAHIDSWETGYDVDEK
jgi:hypothetical protein